MKRRHPMPFGADADGAATRFRLWAPAAGRVIYASDPPPAGVPIGNVLAPWSVAWTLEAADG